MTRAAATVSIRRSSRPTGAQAVYEALKREIIAAKLAPGSPLEEAELCRAFRVSRTPMREAMIRLASEDLVELAPNRGARVSSMQFVDVVDHYEAMDVLQPTICHFAAARRTEYDLAAMRDCLQRFSAALVETNTDALVLANFALHEAIAVACHNRSLEKAYRRMLLDKLRIAQHGMHAMTPSGFVRRLRQTFRVSEKLVFAIAEGDCGQSELIAAELSASIRGAVIETLSGSLGPSAKVRPEKLREIDQRHSEIRNSHANRNERDSVPKRPDA